MHFSKKAQIMNDSERTELTAQQLLNESKITFFIHKNESNDDILTLEIISIPWHCFGHRYNI